MSIHAIQGNSSWQFVVGDINGHFESVPARICCKFSLLLLPSVVLQCWDVNFLADISLILNHLWLPPGDIHSLEQLVRGCSLPRQLWGCFKIEESGMVLYDLFYIISEKKYFFTVNNISLLKILYWDLVTLMHAISGKITEQISIFNLVLWIDL